MARKSQALWTVKVWFVGEKRMPLISYFLSRKEAYDYEMALDGRAEVARIEVSPGYQIWKTAEEALESYMMWAR